VHCRLYTEGFGRLEQLYLERTRGQNWEASDDSDHSAYILNRICLYVQIECVAPRSAHVLSREDNSLFGYNK